MCQPGSRSYVRRLRRPTALRLANKLNMDDEEHRSCSRWLTAVHLALLGLLGTILDEVLPLLGKASHNEVVGLMLRSRTCARRHPWQMLLGWLVVPRRISKQRNVVQVSPE